jgi:hypothetical protein
MVSVQRDQESPLEVLWLDNGWLAHVTPTVTRTVVSLVINHCCA